jgi:chemotaxis protein MotB
MKPPADDLESQMNKSALWAITYGDLMSFLAVFFLILFVSVNSKGLGTQMAMRGLQNSFSKQRTDVVIKELFSKEGLQKVASVELKNDKIRIVFSEPVLFASGDATLHPKAVSILHQVADVLRALPNPVTIEGHTDNVPLRKSKKAYDTNWQLSMARAYSVLQDMINKEGIQPNRLSAVGYGEFKPVKPNDTPEGRAANRRIEINILPVNES